MMSGDVLFRYMYMFHQFLQCGPFSEWSILFGQSSQVTMDVGYLFLVSALKFLAVLFQSPCKHVQPHCVDDDSHVIYLFNCVIFKLLPCFLVASCLS